MILPFPRLSCSVLLFLCMHCPQMIILHCLRRSYSHCVEGLAINLQYRHCKACYNYLDAHSLALQNSFSSYNALSCLINFNSMNLPFPRLSCPVPFFLCMHCPQMVILYCLRRSNIRCVDDLTITFQSRHCNSLQ